MVCWTFLDIICFRGTDFAITTIVYIKNREVKSSYQTDMAFVINNTLV